MQNPVEHLRWSFSQQKSSFVDVGMSSKYASDKGNISENLGLEIQLSKLGVFLVRIFPHSD